jgi:hypothetical protein
LTRKNEYGISKQVALTISFSRDITKHLMKTKKLSTIFKTAALTAVLFTAFLTACKNDDAVNPASDTTKPTVTLTNPLNNATGVVVSQAVVITFSEAMDQTTLNASTFTMKEGTNVIAGAVTSTSTTSTFTPTAALTASKTYIATITTGSKDVAGNAIAANQTVTFTTAAAPDATAPTVTLTSPLNNATGVAASQAVVITFSEAMDQTTLSALTFTLKEGTTVIAGAVTSTSTTATFTPSAALTGGKTYIATISTGAKDVAGNALAANQTVSFTTLDVTAPTITVTDPLSSAINVARNKAITVTFSEAMNASTITTSSFTVKQGSTAVAGTVTYADKVATFTPSVIFDAALLYTVLVTTSVKDVAGNALAQTTWGFTTSANATTLAAVNLGAAANYVILAKTAINNTPTSAITGDLGLSPAATSYVTGFALTNATGYATSPQVTGKIYAADMASPTSTNLTTAVENMITAYNDAAGRPTPDFLELATGNIGGKTLAPGLYKWTTAVTMPSSVVISGGANDVWIFQISGNLSMSSAVNITLTGGAQAKNIFWQVAGAVSIGTTAHFEGNILSMTNVTFQTGASINGRALAQTSVILDGNAVTKPQ